MRDAAEYAPIAAEVRRALHDLCQPLTALQCGLYLGLCKGEMDNDAAEMKAALTEGLEQCDRMVARVRALQNRMEELKGEVE